MTYDPDDEMTKEEWFELACRLHPGLTLEEFEKDWNEVLEPSIAHNRRMRLH